MPETNPRFPHWCRILRKTTDDPMEDEENFSPLDAPVGRQEGCGCHDDDYDPMASDEENDGGGDSSDEGDATVIGSEKKVIYEGVCRSYKINTTSDKGDVITSQRGLALPLNQDGWDELGAVPMEGDEIVVIHGSTFKEYGRVVDKNVATASFAGTHLIWRYGRN